MTSTLEHQTTVQSVEKAIQDAATGYWRLVLLVGPPASGKTVAIREAAMASNLPIINLNLSLSQRLLELTRKQRALRVQRTLADELAGVGTEAVLIDNIELLFDQDLAQDPLRLLQSLSRNRTIVSTWPGTFDGTHLTYAEPSHPEWRRYTKPEAVILKMSDTQPA